MKSLLRSVTRFAQPLSMAFDVRLVVGTASIFNGKLFEMGMAQIEANDLGGFETCQRYEAAPPKTTAFIGNLISGARSSRGIRRAR